jgi:hypothetical protein
MDRETEFPVPFLGHQADTHEGLDIIMRNTRSEPSAKDPDNLI